MKRYTDKDLTYAADTRCPCGAGLAYGPMCVQRPMKGPSYWDCSDILMGRAAKVDSGGFSVRHTALLPFAFYEIKSENQPSAKGLTTRPD